MKEETVSIIIPVKNAGRYLAAQLEAISRQEGAPPFDVLVIDSGSVDDTLLIAARHSARAISIPPSEFNHGGTRNLGARETAGEYIVFLTQDATPADASWLRNLIAPLVGDASVAGAFSRHIPRPGCRFPLVRQIEEGWPQAGGRERIVKRVRSREELEARKAFLVYFADTSSCLRRAVWESIPFRDLEFGEDVDWAERTLLAGHSIVYEPSSAVLHSHDYTLREQLRQHYDYGRMVRSARLAPPITLRGSLKTAVVSIRDDSAWLRRKGLPARRVLSSVPFHAACTAGRWLGEHSDRLPRCAARWCSRQGLIREGAR